MKFFFINNIRASAKIIKPHNVLSITAPTIQKFNFYSKLDLYKNVTNELSLVITSNKLINNLFKRGKFLKVLTLTTKVFITYLNSLKGKKQFKQIKINNLAFLQYIFKFTQKLNILSYFLSYFLINYQPLFSLRIINTPKKYKKKLKLNFLKKIVYLKPMQRQKVVWNLFSKLIKNSTNANLSLRLLQCITSLSSPQQTHPLSIYKLKIYKKIFNTQITK